MTTQVTIHIDAATEAFLEEWLWIQGALSVGSEPPHVADRKLTALFEDLDTTVFETSLREALEGFGGDIKDISYAVVNEQAWQEKWRENFKPLRIGSFQIVGEWEEIADDPRVIRVYPGQAFGTGQHETTQLIIERLEEIGLSGKRVLDVGCGTGILSIAAERLGAIEVFGFDNDPDCLENMDRHLRINNTKRTKLSIGTLDDFHLQPFDIILANITINVLREVWPGLKTLLKPNGILLNSGILVEQRVEAEQALAEHGFQVGRVRQKGEWLMIEAQLS
jgi:ribosomal protein L11 methyltransferase